VSYFRVALVSVPCHNRLGHLTAMTQRGWVPIMFLFRVSCLGALFYFRFTHFTNNLISVSSKWVVSGTLKCSVSFPCRGLVLYWHSFISLHFRVKSAPNHFRVSKWVASGLFHFRAFSRPFLITAIKQKWRNSPCVSRSRHFRAISVSVIRVEV